MTSSRESPDSDSAAMEYAWRWFSLHAGQRLQLFNFFFGSSAVLATAYATSFGKKDWVVAVSIGLAACLVSVSFWRLDIRTAELVHKAEDALGELEKRLGGAESNLVARSEASGKRFTRYSHVMRPVEVGLAATFFAAACYAAAQG